MRNIEAITRQAIERGGGNYVVARLLGITRQAVEQWKSVPASKVLAVEKITGVSRHDLRPDIFGPPPGRPKSRQSLVAAG